MKIKTLIIFLAVVMCSSMTGCKSISTKEAAKPYLEKIKETEKGIFQNSQKNTEIKKVLNTAIADGKLFMNFYRDEDYEYYESSQESPRECLQQLENLGYDNLVKQFDEQLSDAEDLTELWFNFDTKDFNINIDDNNTVTLALNLETLIPVKYASFIEKIEQNKSFYFQDSCIGGKREILQFFSEDEEGWYNKYYDNTTYSAKTILIYYKEEIPYRIKINVSGINDKSNENIFAEGKEDLIEMVALVVPEVSKDEISSFLDHCSKSDQLKGKIGKHTFSIRKNKLYFSNEIPVELEYFIDIE